MAHLGIALIVFALARAVRGRSAGSNDLPARQLHRRRLIAAAFALGVGASVVKKFGFELWFILPLFAATTACAWPELWFETLLIPLGWVRAVYGLERASGGAMLALERGGSWALPAARAWARRPSAAGLAFIERRLDLCHEQGTCCVAAQALVALQRGQREAAREVFEALHAMDERELPRSVQKLARDVLVLDALARGRSAQAHALAWARPAGELGQCVERWLLALGPRLSKLRGRFWSWLYAPHRRHTLELMRRAREASASQSAQAGLQAYAALLCKHPGDIRDADVRECLHALDRLRADADFERMCGARALRLGASPDAIVDVILEPAERGLTQLVLDERLPLSWFPLGRTHAAVSARVSDEHFARLHTLVNELNGRLDIRADLPMFEEWRAWNALRVAASVAADRSMAFRAVYAPLTSWIVQLVNRRNQRVLGRTMAVWLRDFGLECSAPDTAELLERNAMATLQDRLPLVELSDCELLCEPRNCRRWRQATRVVLGALAVGVPLVVCIVSAQLRLAAFGWITLVGTFSGLLTPWRVLDARCVDVLRGEHGVTLQNAHGCFVICRGDLAFVRMLAPRLVFLRMRRKPRWVPGWMVTLTADRAQTRELLTELDSLRQP
jgi:hypothetical protein